MFTRIGIALKTPSLYLHIALTAVAAIHIGKIAEQIS
jgi:hypothetical protein